MNYDDDGLKVGQRWYACMPGVSGIREVQIMHLSEKTVQLMELPHSHLHVRYERDGVNFIERIITGDSK